MPSNIDDLAERLSELRRRDPHGKVFGASGGFGHGYRLRPPLREQSLIAYEYEHQIRLPDDYREFVLRVADGGAGPYYGIAPLAQAEHGELAVAFPYTAEDTAAPGRASVAVDAETGNSVVTVIRDDRWFRE